MKNRIIGIDVARALAVFGMILTHFKIVFGNAGSKILNSFANFFDGKSAATFVVLAGIGLSLMNKSAIKNKGLVKFNVQITKRAIFLLIVGLSYLWIWPADILHSYAIYMLISLLFIQQKSKTLITGLICIIMIFPILLFFFNYETGWNFTDLYYQDLWTVNGFIRNLFFNGYNPVIPWVSFMLFGMWLGRQDLNDHLFLKIIFRFSGVTFIVLQIISYVLLNYFSYLETQSFEIAKALFGTDPMPPMPIFMLNGISIAATVISGTILISKRFSTNLLIVSLHKTGRLALTFYVAHVIIGIGVMEEMGGNNLGNYDISFSILYALVFSLACILFAVVWTKYNTLGPLEWVMRKLTDS